MAGLVHITTQEAKFYPVFYLSTYRMLFDSWQLAGCLSAWF